MPRGKELEQLPKANIAPSAGNEKENVKKDELYSVVQQEKLDSTDVEKENEDMI